MVIFQGDSRFLLIIGEGFQLVLTPRSAKKTFTGILSFKEKEVVDPATGELVTCRMLNDDETRCGNFVIMPGSEPDYGNYPVCVTIQAPTRIAEVEPYALEVEFEEE